MTEECTENIGEVKIADENERICSKTICVILTVIVLAISIGNGTYFCLFSLALKKVVTPIKFGTYSMELRSNNNLINSVTMNI